MAIVITKHGSSVIEIDDSTKAESTFYNFDEIVMRSAGDLMIISQKKVIQNGVEELKIDFNDVTTPAGTTSGADLLRTVSQLF
jgi:hypothetical protein